jgi:hypothetical protein
MGGDIIEYNYPSNEVGDDMYEVIRERAEEDGFSIADFEYPSPDFLDGEEGKQLLRELPEGTTRCLVVSEADEDIAIKLLPRGASVPPEYEGDPEYKIVNGIIDGGGVFKEFATKEKALAAALDNMGGRLQGQLMNVTHVATEDGQDWFLYCFGSFRAI